MVVPPLRTDYNNLFRSLLSGARMWKCRFPHPPVLFEILIERNRKAQQCTNSYRVRCTKAATAKTKEIAELNPVNSDVSRVYMGVREVDAGITTDFDISSAFDRM